MKFKKIVTSAVAVLMSAGLAFSTVSTAQAAVSRTYSTSKAKTASISGGYYSGSYSLKPTSSTISLYSFSSNVFCKAVQDYRYYSSVGVAKNHQCYAGVSLSKSKTLSGDTASFVVG